MARYAADVARAGIRSDLYRELSGLMCWDAVIRCALNGGAISLQRAEELTHIDWRENFARFVSPHDTLVRTPEEMKRVPAGAFIAFIEVDQPDQVRRSHHIWKGRRHILHAMISIGDGWAVGNKNSCIGIGEHVGWEALDLADELNWIPSKHRYNAVNACPLHIQKSRPIRIRFRDLPSYQEAGSRIWQRPSSDLRPVRRIPPGKATVVGDTEVCDVGPLQDCVALLVVRPATPQSAPGRDASQSSPHGRKAFVWHVNGGRVDSDLMAYRGLREFQGDDNLDWYFVHGANADKEGPDSFERQNFYEALVEGMNTLHGHEVRSFRGNRLVVDGTGSLLNLEELHELRRAPPGSR
ncbi:MAG: hypothetical protein WA994_02355 [Ornithinimicrobium sp.]